MNLNIWPSHQLILGSWDPDAPCDCGLIWWWCVWGLLWPGWAGWYGCLGSRLVPPGLLACPSPQSVQYQPCQFFKNLPVFDDLASCRSPPWRRGSFQLQKTQQVRPRSCLEPHCTIPVKIFSPLATSDFDTPRSRATASRKEALVLKPL